MGMNDKRVLLVLDVIVLNRMEDGRKMYSSRKCVLSFIIRVSFCSTF